MPDAIRNLVIITGEKGLVEDLRDADHTDVQEVYDPAGEPPAEPVEDATLVVDLRPVMSDRMAQFVSSWNLAGYPVRALSTVYEEYTGRLPMVHLAEGWELSAPVRRNEYAGVKRIIDILLVLLTAPLWIVLATVIWMAVRIDSSGPAIYRQERIGRECAVANRSRRSTKSPGYRCRFLAWDHVEVQRPPSTLSTHGDTSAATGPDRSDSGETHRLTARFNSRRNEASLEVQAFLSFSPSRGKSSRDDRDAVVQA